MTLSGAIYRLDPGISSGDGADSIDGGADNDNLSGGIGNDTLNGGTGTDTMLGGAGSDVYVIDNAGDIVDESIAGSNGNDHVQSSISFSLANGQGQCRTLVLLGAANVDTIADFSVPDATIQLENAIFTALDVGTLAASALPHRCWRRRRARPHNLQQRHRRADLRQQRQCCRRRHPVHNPFNRPCHDKRRFLRGMRAASGDSCRIIRVGWSNA